MAVSFLLTITWPFELRNRPTHHSPLAEKRAYVTRFTWHTGGIVIALVGAGIGAALVSRQAKQEYREESLRNLKRLVEGEEEP